MRAKTKQDMAVLYARDLAREHRDWTWTKIANTTRRMAGLGPIPESDW